MQKKIARVLFFMTSIELNNCTDVVADFVDYQFGGSACRWEHEWVFGAVKPKAMIMINSMRFWFLLFQCELLWLSPADHYINHQPSLASINSI